MKKELLIGFLLLSLLILAGCGEIDVSELSDKDLARISEKAVVCNKPYIRVGMECCLDENDNNICDEDETKKTEMPQEQPGCTDECSSDSCDGFNYISCLKGDDGCKDKQNEGKVKNKCGVECLSNSDCKSDEECKNYKCEEKPKEQEAITEIKDAETTTDTGTGSGILDSLKELIESLEETTRINSKIDECTKICAGEDYDIPVIKNEFYLACYQIYYYAGEEELDKYIAECK